MKNIVNIFALSNIKDECFSRYYGQDKFIVGENKIITIGDISYLLSFKIRRNMCSNHIESNHIEMETLVYLGYKTSKELLVFNFRSALFLNQIFYFRDYIKDVILPNIEDIVKQYIPTSGFIHNDLQCLNNEVIINSIEYLNKLKKELEVNNKIKKLEKEKIELERSLISNNIKQYWIKKIKL